MAKYLKGDWFYNVALTIMLCTAVKSFIADVLKCKARVKTKFKCVCITMCSLVMSPFSRDYIKTKIEVSVMFNLFT